MGFSDDMDVSVVENVCENFFGGAAPAEYQALNFQLESFLNDPGNVQKCLMLIGRCATHYSTYFGALGLTRAYGRVTLCLSSDEILSHAQQIMNGLFYSSRALPVWVQSELAKAYATLAKRYWSHKVAGEYVMRSVLDRMATFHEIVDPAQRHAYIVLLTNVTSLMTSADDGIVQRSSQFRAARLFREQYLCAIFRLAALVIREYGVGAVSVENAALVERAVLLCKECLISQGSTSESPSSSSSSSEFSDSLSVCVRGSANLAAFLAAFNADTVRALFGLALKQDDALACSCLSLLAVFAAVDLRAEATTLEVFDTGDIRAAFQAGIVSLLSSHRALLGANAQLYFECVRLLAANAARSPPPAADFLELVTDFSLFGIEKMQASSTNLLQTLTVWRPMVAAAAAAAGARTREVDAAVLRVANAFVEHRLAHLACVSAADDDTNEALLDALADLVDSTSCLDQLCAHVFALFDPVFEALRLDAARARHAQLAWLVHLMSQFIRRATVVSRASRRRCEMFAQITLRVLRSALAVRNIIQKAALTDNNNNMMMMMETCLTLLEGIEFALLTFLQNFVFHVLNSNYPLTGKLLALLAAAAALGDESGAGGGDIVGFLLNQIIWNLSWCHLSLKITDATLDLFAEILSGHNTSRSALEVVGSALNFVEKCDKGRFPLFSNRADVSFRVFHSRSKLFQALGMLMAAAFEATRNENEFLANVQMLESNFAQIDAMFGCSQQQQQQQQQQQTVSKDTQLAIVGMSRDLRGLIRAIVEPTPYAILVNYLLLPSTKLRFVVEALDRWFDVPEISIPVLRLLQELSVPRANESCSSRLHICRLVSKAVCVYSSRIAALAPEKIPQDSVYSIKLKGVSVCLHAFANLLSCPFVRSDIFDVYKDPSLALLFEATFHMLAGVSADDVMAFAKLRTAYFSLMKRISQSYVEVLTGLDNASFIKMLDVLKQGLDSPECELLTASSNILAPVLNTAFELLGNKKIDKKNADNLFVLIRDNRSELDDLMINLLNVVLFENTVMLTCVQNLLMLLIQLDYEMFTRQCEAYIQSLNAEPNTTTALQRLFATFSTAAAALPYNDPKNEFVLILMDFRKDVADLMEDSKLAQASAHADHADDADAKLQKIDADPTAMTN